MLYILDCECPTGLEGECEACKLEALERGIEQAMTLTREQVETTIRRMLSWHDCDAACDHDLQQIITTDAALRQQFATAQARVRELEEEKLTMYEEAEHVAGETLARLQHLDAQLATVTQERDDAMRIAKTFLDGGVTEELLRRQDGCIKLANGCCIVIEAEWDRLLAEIAALNWCHARAKKEQP